MSWSTHKYSPSSLVLLKDIINPEVIDVYFDSIDGWQKLVHQAESHYQNAKITASSWPQRKIKKQLAPSGCGDGAFSWRTTKWRESQLL
jgi:hypothetical protein